MSQTQVRFCSWSLAQVTVYPPGVGLGTDGACAAANCPWQPLSTQTMPGPLPQFWPSTQRVLETLRTRRTGPRNRVGHSRKRNRSLAQDTVPGSPPSAPAPGPAPDPASDFAMSLLTSLKPQF